MIHFAEEKWATFWPDCQELLPLHHEELAINKDVMKMEIDVPVYEALEVAGRLFILTLRDGERMVGYLVAFPMPNHLHYKSSGPIALSDMFYILPEYRTGNGAKMFIEFERHMRKRGCIMIASGFKIHSPQLKLFEALGWTNSDATVLKILK